MIKVLLLLGFLLATLAAAQEPHAITVPYNAQQTDSVVYITREGKKYHSEGCSYLNKSKLKVSLREAIENRYEPCKRCFKSGDRDSL